MSVIVVEPSSMGSTWRLVFNGVPVPRLFETREDAIAAARRLGRRHSAEVRVHKQNGGQNRLTNHLNR